MAQTRKSGTRRCLIVERHLWETGGGEQQLQFVLGLAKQFFGPGRRKRRIHVRVFMPAGAPAPAFVRDITISREYANKTRRTNAFREMGAVPSSFVFFEETPKPGVYDFWWQEDKAIVVAKYQGLVWSQGRSTQYGRGRLSIIVTAPVRRPISQL